jgi:ribose transport system substrate-binding protein
MLCLIVSVVLIASMTLMAGCNSSGGSSAAPAGSSAAATEEPAGSSAAADAVARDYDIGVAFYDLNDPFWAETANCMKEYGEENGCTVTIVSAEINAAKQVQQVEDFISKDVDILVIGAVDPATLEEATKKAMDAGIIVYGYCFALPYETAEIIVDDADMGAKVAEMAADFIDKNLGGKAQIGMFNLPLYPSIVIREEAIREKMAELSPESEFVMTAESATIETGMTAAENFLQAYPDMKVITSIGDGGAYGAMQGFENAGKAGDDVAIYGTGGNIENLQAIKDGKVVRGTVALGYAMQRAQAVLDTCFAAIEGGEYEKMATFTNTSVTIDNIDQYCADAGITLE